MTVEIRELVVRASVDSGAGSSSASQANAMPPSSSDQDVNSGEAVQFELTEAHMDLIVDRCLDRLFRILEEQGER